MTLALDIPLNDTGREQARRAAEVLAGVAPDAVVASDLVRAADTARAVAGVWPLRRSRSTPCRTREASAR